eukprot:TRINITY_DN1257_c1_g1_i2.p3 TRINITY_DN1257_c1_g1~~TRINITY_DN1257_c1_g1_i2.p3  ORF type:complete len:157 (-),score=4.03 TRINITY_DN1257_c1_g1_i2:75-545(-)
MILQYSIYVCYMYMHSISYVLLCYNHTQFKKKKIKNFLWVWLRYYEYTICAIVGKFSSRHLLVKFWRFRRAIIINMFAICMNLIVVYGSYNNIFYGIILLTEDCVCLQGAVLRMGGSIFVKEPKGYKVSKKKKKKKRKGKGKKKKERVGRIGKRKK